MASESDALAIRQPVFRDDRVVTLLRPNGPDLPGPGIHAPDSLIDKLPGALVTERQKFWSCGRRVYVRDIAAILV
jgi:hypothetical protein